MFMLLLVLVHMPSGYGCNSVLVNLPEVVTIPELITLSSLYYGNKKIHVFKHMNFNSVIIV